MVSECTTVCTKNELARAISLALFTVGSQQMKDGNHISSREHNLHSARPSGLVAIVLSQKAYKTILNAKSFVLGALLKKSSSKAESNEKIKIIRRYKKIKDITRFIREIEEYYAKIILVK